MAQLSRGDRVVDPDDPTATAVVVNGPEMIGGQRFYLIRKQDGEESFFPETDLARREVPPDSPVGWLSKQALADPDHLARLLTQLRLTSGLTDIIYSLSSTRTLFRVHQFKPVLKLIQSPSQRLLLADEVGLGKTVEAGLIWAEIDARMATSRVLIVCPSGLRTKWQLEMRRRFDREVEVADRARMLELLDLYHERGDAARFAAIASFNTMRDESVLDSLSTRPPTLDLVIIDEAHAMRNPETRTHQVGELLGQNSRALLLLSATPVNLGSADLFQLLKLLAPDQYADQSVFDRVLAPNEYVNDALRALTSTGCPDPHGVAECLRRVETTQEAGRFSRNPRYGAVLRQLDAATRLSPAEVNDVAQGIAELNTLSPVYNRTRKRDLTDHVAVRRAATLDVQLSAVEADIYAATGRLVARLQARAGGAVGLATVMPSRQAASCLPVMADYLEDALRAGRFQTDLEEGEEDEEGTSETSVDASNAATDAASVIRLCRQLRGVDTKLTKLLEYLRNLRAEGTRQALIFSFFRRTLAYLGEQLATAGFSCAVMDGSTALRDRDTLMRRFRAGEVDLLLCSEIGSEGLDFEFCSVVVNYDLPWNPMRLEQRIGRVDRFGQQSPVIHVVNFDVPGTIDTEIFLRLYTRIGVFERSIGELEPILGRQLHELNRTIATQTLTEDEQESLAIRIALAVEGERSALERFEANRDRLIGTDAYVSDSLQRAQDERRYITPDELRRYLAGFLREEATPARLDGEGPVLALTGSPALADLLRSHGRSWSTPEFRELISKLETGGPISVTFDAATAYAREAEFIHARHPVIRAVNAYYEDHASLPPGGYARIPAGHRGSYIFFVYRVTASGLAPMRSLAAVAWDRATRAADLGVGQQILSYLAGPDPVRIQQRHLPILDDDEVRTAHDASQTMMVAHREQLQIRNQERNDALIAIRQDAVRSGVDVQRAWLEEILARPNLEERIRRMRKSQLANIERRGDEQIEDLEQHRKVSVGFKVLAGGIADFVD